jgi:hypothetical protein
MKKAIYSLLAVASPCIALAQTNASTFAITYTIDNVQHYKSRAPLADAELWLYSNKDGGRVIGKCHGANGIYSIEMPHQADYGKFVLFSKYSNGQSVAGNGTVVPVVSTARISPITVKKVNGLVTANWHCTSYPSAYASAVTLQAFDNEHHLLKTISVPLQASQEIYSISELPANTKHVQANLDFASIKVTESIPVNTALSGNIVEYLVEAQSSGIIYNNSNDAQDVTIYNSQGHLVCNMKVASGKNLLPSHLASGNYILQCASNQQALQFVVQ